MSWVLVVTAVTALAVVVATVLTREPTEPLALAFLTVGIGLAVGATAARLFLGRAPGRRRGRGGLWRALRRGFGVGVMVGLLVFLRVIDGLIPITAVFVVLAFALAEVVLSARAA